MWSRPQPCCCSSCRKKAQESDFLPPTIPNPTINTVAVTHRQKTDDSPRRSSPGSAGAPSELPLPSPTRQLHRWLACSPPAERSGCRGPPQPREFHGMYVCRNLFISLFRCLFLSFVRCVSLSVILGSFSALFLLFNSLWLCFFPCFLRSLFRSFFVFLFYLNPKQ